MVVKRRAAPWVGALAVFVLLGAVVSAFDEGPVSTPRTGVVSSTPTRAPSPAPTIAPSAAPTSAPSAMPSAAPETASPQPSVSPTPPPVTVVDGTLALLETLPIKGRAPKTGYDREEQFGSAWRDVDGNNCDTRNDILRRDLVDITLDDGCTVLTGTLIDPYTGDTVAFVRGVGTSNAVQIDHVVALLNAWETGAQQLTAADRLRLANDPRNLIAVSGRANAQKGAGDAATWLPANRDHWCAYVSSQIEVKAAYRLWVTAAERDAMVRVLQRCTD